ncbi:capsule assembly Wzi family protein [Maribellus maritimus]|uniref:capsule assembly Wzi family protein n=1 Tax=Maribellus maritimus TaxID=2870838 RepID=UPI001EECD74E|nr:capsule assembly Wzi family protein [Maribellus maritimus]MCG6187202.1 capsule assembly Wzi family protein [Maribellus maritimus]
MIKVILLAFGLSILFFSGQAQKKNIESDSIIVESSKPKFSSNDSYTINTDNYLETSVSLSRIAGESKEFKNKFPQGNFKTHQKEKNYSAFLSAGAFGTTNGVVPFWMRSMRHGSIPSEGISVSLIGGAFKDYQAGTRQKLMDWGTGFEGRVNAGNNSKFILIEAYAKVRLSIFELKGGRFREQVGYVDSTLSSGAFSLSGNTLGVPKIKAGIPNYWNVPLTKGVIAIKGNVAHGWMDKQTLNKKEDNTVLISETDAYLHQLSAYGRVGKPTWRIKLYGGVNHMVVWGYEKEIFPGWELSEFNTLKYVVIGKKYGTGSIPTSKVGNHIGSIDQGIEWQVGQTLVNGYHQFFYDVGALATLANAKDGLWGLSIKNEKAKSGNFYWNKFLFEFLYSKSQGGEIDSKPRASGAENYYNNFLYLNGWAYNGENLGNPLFTPEKHIKSGYPTTSTQYFPNNRIIAFHGGTEFQLKNWFCKGLLTYSLNYGTYRTSRGERGLGSVIYYYEPPYFPKLHQFSAYLESQRELNSGFELGIQLAIDQGKLLYNSIGAGISLTKRW